MNVRPPAQGHVRIREVEDDVPPRVLRAPAGPGKQCAWRRSRRATAKRSWLTGQGSARTTHASFRPSGTVAASRQHRDLGAVGQASRRLLDRPPGLGPRHRDGRADAVPRQGHHPTDPCARRRSPTSARSECWKKCGFRRLPEDDPEASMIGEDGVEEPSAVRRSPTTVLDRLVTEIAGTAAARAQGCGGGGRGTDRHGGWPRRQHWR